MKLAWFRATHSDAERRPDDISALIAELRSTHEIVLFTAANAHDFVWMHFRTPFDLCIHELNNTAAHRFIWPYLLHYSGILLLRTLTLHDSRADALAHEGRLDDYRAELAFNRGGALRAPLLAARVTIVSHAVAATALQDEYPEARVRYAPVGIHDASRLHGDDRSGPPAEAHRRDATLRFGLLEYGNRTTLQRAVQRACEAGARAELLVDRPSEEILEEADVILALRWPAFGEPHIAALLGMAAGKPVVVFETDTTADWPALDPQTWRPRGLSGSRPIAVSIDPRDEEHSLMLTVRRLAADEALRAELGSAARDWWRTHATVRHAAEAWERILREAASVEPPGRPHDWPVHLNADGTELAREILGELGVTVDFLA